MVRLAGFAAINEEGRAEHDASQQTIEALESRVIDEYERALREIQANNLAEAEAAFRSVLSDQLVIDGATEQLQRLRFLSLKNLAGVIASPRRAHEALELFDLAAREDATDVALWDRYGTLAAETGEWAAAKSAFEEALSRDPRHPTVSTKLLQLLVHVGDTARADAFAKFCLDQDPWHPLARRVVANKTGEEMAAAGIELLSLPPLYSGPVTPVSSTSALFSTAHVATVNLEMASWRHLLRQCIKLLSNPLAAVANVKFIAPQETATAAVGVIASPLPAAAAVPPGPAPMETSVAIPPQNMVPEVQKSTEQLPPSGSTAAAMIDDNNREPQPSEIKDAAEAVSPQRRSVRATKSKHKSGGQTTNNALDASTTTTKDPFNLLRTLAPSLCPPQRPESARLSEQSEEDEKEPEAPGSIPPPNTDTAAAAAATVVTAVVESEAEQVRSCELLKVNSVPALQAAITLALHFTQPQHASRLPQLTGSSGAVLKLISMLEKHQQWKGHGMSPEQYLVVGELFSDAATTMMRASTGHGGTSKHAVVSLSPLAAAHHQNVQELSLVEFLREGALWLSRFRSSHLMVRQEGEQAALLEVRYWWARGRLCEASSKPSEAFECYSQCNALLLAAVAEQEKNFLDEEMEKEKSSKMQSKGSSKNKNNKASKNNAAAGKLLEIKLPHCCLEATITPKTVEAKLELLQLHGVLTQAQQLLSQDQHADAAALLAPVLLPCSDTEALMAAVDRSTWIKALRTLRNAADTVQDSMLALRCHLRLLRAGLPLVPSKIEAVLQDPENDQESGNEAPYSSPLPKAHFFIDTQHFAATGAAADLAAAAVFLGKSENFEKIKNTISSASSDFETTSTSALHPTFEVHALRMLIKQNLALVHSCGAALHATPDRRSTINTRAVILRHSMSDAAVVGLQLWLLDTASKCTPGYILEWCYGLTDALAGVGALTERHGALAAVVLPHLQQALATAESMLESHEKHTEFVASASAAVSSKKKKTSAAVVVEPASDLLTEEEAEELKDVVESLKCGIDNCLLWLYGVRLPGVDEEEWGGSVVITNTGLNTNVGGVSASTPGTTVMAAGAAGVGMNHPSTSSSSSLTEISTTIMIPPGGLRPLASQDAALAMWPSVSDHLVGQSVSALQKHKGFLENMAKLFPGLPSALQVKVDAALVQLVQQKPPELHGNLKGKIKNPFEGIVEAALLELQLQERNEVAEETTSNISDWVKYLPIYRTFFHLLSLVQPATPSILDNAGFSESLGILNPESDSTLSTKIFAPVIADLAINPRKYPERWSSLALLYYEVADLILIKAAHEVPTRQWLHRTDLHRRVNLYGKLGHWCTAINALCLASQQGIDTDSVDEEKAELLELSGSKQYEKVNDVPPQYNQIDIRPARDDPALLQATECALRAYQAAAGILPDEWAFKMHIGRCLRRLGRPPKEYLPLFARACYNAVQHHNGGLVDPVYTLHNARMKLVVEVQQEVIENKSATNATKLILCWVGKFCFLKETQDHLKNSYPRFFESNGNIKLSLEQATACCTAILTDCTAAMEWCLEKQKGFHRASIALAKIAAAKKDYEQVVKHLSPLFSKYKVLFTLNMSPIVATTGVDGGKRNSKQKRRNNTGAGGGGADKQTNIFDSATPMTTTEGAEITTPETTEISEFDYGICPTAKNIGIGVLESEVIFISRVRKALYLYLTALVHTGGRDILAAADQFFDNVRLNKDAIQTYWMSKPGFEDIRKLTKGYHVLSLLSSAFDICPLASTTSLPVEEERSAQASPSNTKGTMRQAQARELSSLHRHLRALASQLNPTTAEPVLQEMYKLWSEHTGIVISNTTAPESSSIFSNGQVYGSNWWEPAVVAPARFALTMSSTTSDLGSRSSTALPHAESLAAILQGPLSQKVAQTYSQLYIHLLAVHGGTEKIKSLLVPLKRRFRKIKLCADEARTLVIQLCSAGVGSLVAETKDLFARAALIAPILAEPAEPLPDLAAGADPAAAGTSGTVGDDGTAVLKSPNPVASSPSRPTLPPPPPVPAAAMIPTTLNQAQMQILQSTALGKCQQYVASMIQENAARGINLPLSAVQFMQERQYNQELADLHRQAITQLSQTRAAALFQHSQAMKQHALQVKMIEEAHSRAASGLVATAPTTTEEQILQERVIQAMQQVNLFIRAAPWLGDEDTLPSLKRAKSGADDLRIDLLRCYLVLGHINLPTTRQQALKLCDEVMKLHKKGVIGGGAGIVGGAGGSGSRPGSAAGAVAPMPPPSLAAPAPQMQAQQVTTQMNQAAPVSVPISAPTAEPSPKRQRTVEATEEPKL